MILRELNCDKILFEEINNEANNIFILSRPIYDIEITNNFQSLIYTSCEVKSILIKKINPIPEKYIVPLQYNSWSAIINVDTQKYRLAALDLGTISLHFMILIENVTENEMYMYTGNFFTIEKLRDNDFFQNNLPQLKKLFFDNKIIKYDLASYMEIISTFVKQHNDYSFAMYLPHLGYEDFLDALIRQYNMTVHVNDLRRLLLQKSIKSDSVFIGREQMEVTPKLIIHKDKNTLNEIKKLYKDYKMCTLSFSSLKEFVTRPKIFGYYLTILEWDEHPTEQMCLELLKMLPENTEFCLMYPEVSLESSNNICQFLVDLKSVVDDDVLNFTFTQPFASPEKSLRIDFSEDTQFMPPYCSSQLPSSCIMQSESSSVNNSRQETSEVNEFCIDDYKDLDLGEDIKLLRYIGKID